MQSQISVREGEEKLQDLGVGDQYQIPDELWDRIHVLIPPPPPKKNEDRPGRPRMNDRKAMNAIFYVARTGCQWGALPRSFGAKSTVHDRFQEWRDAEVFQNMHVYALRKLTRDERISFHEDKAQMYFYQFVPAFGVQRKRVKKSRRWKTTRRFVRIVW